MSTLTQGLPKSRIKLLICTPTLVITSAINLRYNNYEPENHQNSAGRFGMSVRLVRDFTQEVNTDSSFSYDNEESTPIISANSYSYSQSLYPKELLNTNYSNGDDLKTIRRITWLMRTDQTLGNYSDEWEIYIAETDDTQLGTNSWRPHSDFTKVFQGTVRESSQTFGGQATTSESHGERKQIIVDLDNEFIRNPNKNLVIAVRDIKANSNSPSTTFETRRHNNQNHQKTLTLGSNDPINLTSLPTNPTSSYNNPWIFLEGTTDSGIEYSQSTITNDAGTLEPGKQKLTQLHIQSLKTHLILVEFLTL